MIRDCTNKDVQGFEWLHASPQFDLWSFGVVLFHALRWGKLFASDNVDNLAHSGEFKRLHEWSTVTLDEMITELWRTLCERERDCHEETALRACDLLTKLLQPDPADRPRDFAEVIEHAFFQGRGGKLFNMFAAPLGEVFTSI